MKIDKKFMIIGIVGLVGVLLLTFGNFGSKRTSEVSANIDTGLDPEVYAQKIEDEVTAICKGVVGEECDVSAVVSLKGGYRSVYATDSQTSSSGHKSSMVLIGSGSSEEAVLVCYENPEISGIGIVLSCKKSEAVKSSVISLVSSAFNVRTNKIYVAFGS